MQTPRVEPFRELCLLCFVALALGACGTDDGSDVVPDADATGALDGVSDVDAVSRPDGTLADDAAADAEDAAADTEDAAIDLGPDVPDIIAPDPCAERYTGPWGELSGVLPIGIGNAESFSLTRVGASDPVEGGIDGLHFYPAEFLEPSSEYEWSAVVHEECPPWLGSFTTTSAGLLVNDPESLVGLTFELPSLYGDRSTAAGVAVNGFAEFGSDCGWPSGGPWHLRVDRLEGNSADVVLAVLGFPSGEFRTQDTCVASVAATAQWDGVRLRLSGDSLPFEVWNSSSPGGFFGVPSPTVIALRNWEADIVVHPLRDGMTVSSFVAQADTRTLGEYGVFAGADVRWEGNGTAENFCQAMDAVIAPLFLGEDGRTTCEPCADGVVACFPFVAWGRGGRSADPVTVDRLIDIDDEQTENHLCADSCENGADDDGDGATDEDVECNSATWP